MLRSTQSTALLLAAIALAACGGGPAPASAPIPGAWARPPGRRPDAVMAPGASLAIPVRGVRPDQLRDSYADARDGGRTHHAIDIMAPEGTPVVAAGDGTILRLRQGGIGGITVYELAPDGHTLYYYAHLQRYAAGMREGTPVWRGQVIAYVGDTGNAGRGNYHLHFSVSRLTDARRWWEGENTNHYPLLAGHRARTAEGGH
jgi:peptidoglycan LD-endopeptidase LytH